MNRFTVSITAIAALAVSAPATAETADGMTAQAKKIIAERMIDPGSLQIRNTKIITTNSPTGKPMQVLCGEYNSKNRMGGFAGFTPFFYEPIEMGGVLSFDLPRRLDFFSSDGKSDYGDVKSAARAGMSMDEIDRRSKRNRDYAREYATACLTSS